MLSRTRRFRAASPRTEFPAMVAGDTRQNWLRLPSCAIGGEARDLSNRYAAHATVNAREPRAAECTLGTHTGHRLFIPPYDENSCDSSHSNGRLASSRNPDSGKPDRATYSARPLMRIWRRRRQSGVPRTPGCCCRSASICPPRRLASAWSACCCSRLSLRVGLAIGDRTVPPQSRKRSRSLGG